MKNELSGEILNGELMLKFIILFVSAFAVATECDFSRFLENDVRGYNQSENQYRMSVSAEHTVGINVDVSLVTRTFCSNHELDANMSDVCRQYERVVVVSVDVDLIMHTDMNVSDVCYHTERVFVVGMDVDLNARIFQPARDPENMPVRCNGFALNVDIDIIVH